MKVLFLDIDGVLNDHTYREDVDSTTMDPRNVYYLNEILREVPDLKIVVSSAWRYLVHRGAMSLKGFESLLRTHWITCKDRLVGLTRLDATPAEPRGGQILEWILGSPEPVTAWVVLDDLDLDLGANQWRFVRTNGKKGLRDEDAKRAIQILKGGTMAFDRALGSNEIASVFEAQKETGT